MAKPLSQLVPDFREALEQGVQQATETVVRELQIEGPYWSGFFADMWQVNVGKKAIKADLVSIYPIPEDPPPDRGPYIDVNVPDSPNLQGYTIGNRAIYRLFAMDILSDPDRGRGKKGARLTAPKDWYDRYINAQMPNTIQREITNVFRRYNK